MASTVTPGYWVVKLCCTSPTTVEAGSNETFGHQMDSFSVTAAGWAGRRDWPPAARVPPPPAPQAARSAAPAPPPRAVSALRRVPARSLSAIEPFEPIRLLLLPRAGEPVRRL